MQKKRRPVKYIVISLILIFVIAIGAITLVNRYYPLRYVDIINEYAGEYGLAPELICAVIRTESRFNKDAVSNKNAGGLMQIIESTAYWLAEDANIKDFDYSQIFNPRINIKLGCHYLNMLISQYGNLDTALCAYNAGEGNVSKWLKNPEYSADGETLARIPFQETRNYVKKISDNQRIYAVLLKLYDMLPH